jgi:hypothetical protein
MAIYLLDRAEVIEEDQRAERSLKEALLATGQVSFATLFPTPGMGVTNESAVGGEDLDSALDNEDDGTVVRYVAPDDEMTEEKMNELLAQLMGEADHGTLDGRALRGEDGWM